MSEFVNNIRIEEGIRRQIRAPVLEILLSGEEVLLSGIPLLVVPAKLEMPIITPVDSQMMYEEPVIVQRIFKKIIKPLGHQHIAEAFVDEEGYPAVQCYNFTDDEIIFGIRKELFFNAKRP